MNQHIDAQISNMLMIASTFQQSCTMAAMKDDGKIDQDESKKIKKINAATERYKKELEKLK